MKRESIRQSKFFHHHTVCMTSVVRSLPQVNGRGQNYSSHETHIPWPTIAKYCTRDYVHHICPLVTFGQNRARGYFSQT